MSTRKGKVVLLADVIAEAIATAKRNIEEKNPHLPNKERVAQQVGLSGNFNDLKYHRLNDIEFSIEQMMNFEGETGPYVQYTYARICSILDKANVPSHDMMFTPLGEQAWPIILLLSSFQKR